MTTSAHRIPTRPAKSREGGRRDASIGYANVSDMGIDTMRSEAAEAGDLKTVALCDRALQGDARARSRCAAALLADASELDRREPSRSRRLVRS